MCIVVRTREVIESRVRGVTLLGNKDGTSSKQSDSRIVPSYIPLLHSRLLKWLSSSRTKAPEGRLI